jgi:hypothetical protein
MKLKKADKFILLVAGVVLLAMILRPPVLMERLAIHYCYFESGYEWLWYGCHVDYAKFAFQTLGLAVASAMVMAVARFIFPNSQK